MQEIRIEEVGDINSEYPYLEVFYRNDSIPFLEISISRNRELVFKLYSSNKDKILKLNDWEYILDRAREFLPKALKDEEDYLGFLTNEEE